MTWLLVLLRNWKMAIGAATVITLGVMLFAARMDARSAHKRVAQLTELREADKKAVANATTEANLAALTRKAVTETKFIKVTDDAQIAIVDRLRSELNRLRASRAVAGSAVVASVPRPAQAAAGPIRADQVPVMDDDREVCTAAVIKARGWQDWAADVAQ